MSTDTLPKQNVPADPPPADVSQVPPNLPRKSWIRWLPLIFLFLLLYLALNIWIYFYGTHMFGTKLGSVASEVSIVKTQQASLPSIPKSSIPTRTPTPTPTPRPIPHGPIDFTVGQTDKTVPQFGKGTINPYDPENGTTQTVTIAIKHTQPITMVTAKLKTDHMVSAPIPFTLMSGTNTNGQWQGSWKMTDTYLYTYQLILEATSETKTGTVEITLR
jgi:hypothetical protein